MAKSGVVLGAVSPHPPIIVPEIGEQSIQRVRATRDGMQQMAALVADVKPDTVVITSPHGPVLRDAVTLMAPPILEGNFREFGIAGSALRYGNDLRLVQKTVAEGATRGVNVFAADPKRTGAFRFPGALHYSILVPLYYLKQAGVECRVVAGAAGLLPLETLYAFGRAVQAAAGELGVRVAYIASGDLSHRLTEGAPAGYDPMGKVFDQKVVEALRAADVEALFGLDAALVDRAGECGLGPIVTLFGALDGLEVVPEVLSYEGPFGVGYCVATFVPKGPGPSRRVPAEDNTEGGEVPGGSGGGVAATADGPAAPGSGGGPEPALDARSGAPPGTEPDSSGGTEPDSPGEHPFVKLARLSLATYVTEGRRVSPPPGSLGLDRRAGAFVSLKKGGELRGCIGTIRPTAGNLAEEIVRNAIQAGTADPRFPAVRESELDELDYSVDVLEPPEPVGGLSELDPKTYGVIVSKGGRTGLLLPDLEGIDSAEEQVSIACRKAGVDPGEAGIRLHRFKVTRYR